MAISPSFIVTNNIGSDTTSFTLTDTSTGSDAAIASRNIIMYKSDNTVFQQLQFPGTVGGSTTPSVLDKDYAINFVVNWLDAGGNLLYTASLLVVFTGYLEWFAVGLVQKVSADPKRLNDPTFVKNSSLLRLLIDNANQVINVNGSISDAQIMISLAQNLVNNAQINF